VTWAGLRKKKIDEWMSLFHILSEDDKLELIALGKLMIERRRKRAQSKRQGVTKRERSTK